MSSQKNDESPVIMTRKMMRDREFHRPGGAWKVVFADFTLSLMVFFLVMWVLLVREQEKGRRVADPTTHHSLWENAGSQRHHDGISRDEILHETFLGSLRRDAGLDGKIKMTESLVRYRYDSVDDMKKLSTLLSDLSARSGLTDHIQTIITPYGLRVMLHDTDQQGMFERGSQVVNARFQRLLQKMGALLQSVDNSLLIVGHTDSLPYKEQDYTAFSNWDLSSERAMAARMHLLEGGMPNQHILQVVGMADRTPLDVSHPTAALNRRIELLVLTTKQAQMVSEMFGMPKKAETVMPGVKIDSHDSEKPTFYQNG